MQPLNDSGRKLIDAVAERHGASVSAVEHLLRTIAAGGGRQAQFNHPELGGMGQWSEGGMIMVGDMFNQDIKAKVGAICAELAAAFATSSPFAPAPAKAMPPPRQSQSQGVGGAYAGGRWPAHLGTPSSTGSQNDLHYALFPDKRRLAIEHGGRITVYDTGDHTIGGFSQQQGDSRTLAFTSQHGPVQLADLRVVTAEGAPGPEPAAPQPAPPPAASPAGSGTGSDDVLGTLERLAALRDKGVITQEDFDAKKAELLARL